MSLPLEILVWVAIVVIGGPVALWLTVAVLTLCVAFLNGVYKGVRKALSAEYRRKEAERARARAIAKSLEAFAEALHGGARRRR